MRMIFVNLPVKDLEASKRFFGALGFTFNAQFSNENTARHGDRGEHRRHAAEHDRFRDFIKGDISDPAKGVEVLTCLSAGSRAEVEDTIAKALAAGGKPGCRLRTTASCTAQLPGPRRPRLGGHVDGPRGRACRPTTRSPNTHDREQRLRARASAALIGG
jgi:predicted lactoylglutathione lyase